MHGLARHNNGVFKLLTSEDPQAFEALRQSLIAELSPSSEIEGILISEIAESRWLAQRAQRLVDSCMDPHTGVIADDKKFSLYMRYQTTHTRAFHKSLNHLMKLRSENRKAEIGFEAQRIKNEQNDRRKQLHGHRIFEERCPTSQPNRRQHHPIPHGHHQTPQLSP